jgi:uncharacterized protein (TIGR03067 family)
MFAAFVALSLAASPAEPPKLSEAAEKELKKFQGKWKAEKVVVNGKEETPTMDGADVFLGFKDRKIALGDKELFEINALDPSTDPKIIDLKALASMGEITKDTVYESIYKFDGDALILAVHIGEGKTRPAKFESLKDSNVVLVTLKRVKE